MSEADLHTRSQRLADHVRREHQQSPIADYFKEVIYGGVDGIITTFAVVAGFSGAAFSNDTTAQLSFAVVLLFGLANLFADATSMGLGNFLSVRSDQDVYRAARRKELQEITNHPDMEVAETVTILEQKGFSAAEAQTVAAIYRNHPEHWVDFMMNHELKIPNAFQDNALFSGIATFTSFIIFGSIPLLPFIFFANAPALTVFAYSIISTGSALVLLGVLKWWVVGSRFASALAEVVIVGGVAASIAFFVGSLFSM